MLGFLKKNAKKQYHPIKDINELGKNNDLYVFNANANISYEDLQSEYGVDKVIDCNEIDDSERKTDAPFAFIRLDAFDDLPGALSGNSDVRCLIMNKDLRNVKIGRLLDHLSELTYEWRDKSDNSLKKTGMTRFYFYKCRFSDLEYKQINDSPVNQQGKSLLIIDSEITRVEIKSEHSIHSIIQRCNIECLEQISGGSKETFTLSINEVDKLILFKPDIRIRDTRLKLFHHKDLDNLKLTIDNVRIQFDRKFVEKQNKDSFAGYWNTFDFIKDKKSLTSEQSEIEKYIHFFDSRKHWFKRLLFSFNEGYTAWKWPLAIAALMILLNLRILQSWMNYPGDLLSTVFYPVSLFKDVIFKDFRLSCFENISLPKLLMLPLEIIFIYASFSFGMAIKKIFGFKITS